MSTQKKPSPKPKAKTAAATGKASTGRGLTPKMREVMWKPGQSGNPKGRPPGSRNKLTEAFIYELHEDFRAHGKEAIEAVRKQRPDAYLKVLASLVPRQVTVDNPLDDVDDDTLALAIAAIAAARGAGEAAGEARGGAGASGLPQ